MKIFSPILKGTTTVAQGTTNLSGSFTGSLLGTAATASYADNFTVGGTLTAQTINVQIITSSIEFVTGSTRNGSLSTNTHQFTGSVLVTGSLTVSSSINAVSTIVTGVGEDGSSGPVIRLNSTHPNAGSRNWAIINTWDNFGDLTFRVSTAKDANAITSGSTKMVILSSGNVGIGTTAPQSLSTNTFKFLDISNIGSSQTAGLTMHAQTGGQEFSIHHTNGVYIDVVGHSTATNNFIQFRVASANSTYTSYVDAMRITSAGNVGIGTTSPVSNDSDSRTFQLGNRLVVQNVIGTQFLIGTNAYYDGTWKYIAAAKYQAIRGTGESGHISFHLASAGTAGGTITNMDGSDIKMIIKESGNVGIGTTSPNIVGFTGPVLTVNGSGNYQGFEVATGGVSRFGIFSQGTIGFVSTRQTGMDIVFEAGAASEKMRISSNGSIGAGGSTTNIYNASDVRLKQNISTITYGLNAVSALNPVKFNWADGFDLIEADKTLLGFIAQEVQEVIPEAIESFGGSVDLNGATIENTLRVNEKFIIPVLVKAIQELSAKNTSLEERLTALENN